jgi:hypothetical protein
MPTEGIRWVVALAVAAHGIGHVLFMPVLSDALGLQVTGRSWLLTPLVGESLVRVVASTVAGAVLVGFVVATGGFVARASWWRAVALGSALASAVLIVTMWDGLQRSSAFFALAFDLAVVASLTIAKWPPEQVLEA